jgi:hypothetical protein
MLHWLYWLYWLYWLFFAAGIRFRQSYEPPKSRRHGLRVTLQRGFGGAHGVPASTTRQGTRAWRLPARRPHHVPVETFVAVGQQESRMSETGNQFALARVTSQSSGGAAGEQGSMSLGAPPQGDKATVTGFLRPSQKNNALNRSICFSRSASTRSWSELATFRTSAFASVSVTLRTK